MKILQIINSHALSDGGAQRLALELHRAYLSRGLDSHLLSLMRSPTSDPNTYSLGFSSPYQTRVWPRLLRFLSQSRWRDTQIIHVHLFPAQLWVALAARRLPLRAHLVTTEHNTFNRRRATRIGRACDRFTLARYERIACISPATREALQKWQPQAEAKLETVLNGIDLTRFSANSKTSISEAKKLIVIAVGRICEQKNYETAIRAIAKLSNPRFELWIVGQDEMNGKMQRLTADLGLTEKVHFLGYRADIPALLSQADIFLLTSRWEGFGLAVAEAMAAGLPVVASDVPGVREVVAEVLGDGNSVGAGFLIDPDSPTDVAARLELLEDAALRQKMGENARRRASEFDVSQTIESYLRLYDTVLPSN